MKKYAILVLTTTLVFPASAQWNNAKGKWTTGVYIGSDYNPIGNKSYGWYQISLRETRWLSNRIGFGAEAGYTKVTESNLANPLSANFFGKIRLIAGLYGELGYGFAGVPFNSTVVGSSAKGTYWAIGISKKLGNHLALDLQYRNAPTPEMLTRNYSNGFRAGLHFKF
jgi:hypothetical protein